MGVGDGERNSISIILCSSNLFIIVFSDCLDILFLIISGEYAAFSWQNRLRLTSNLLSLKYFKPGTKYEGLDLS